jgi:transcriptional regulator with XRE-family HTH domain
MRRDHPVTGSGDGQNPGSGHGSNAADPMPNAGLDSPDLPGRLRHSTDALDPVFESHGDTLRIETPICQGVVNTNRVGSRPAPGGIVGGMPWYDVAKQRLHQMGSGSRAKLQEALGVEESTLRSYLNGTRKPDIDRLAAIADFLQLSVDELLGRTKYAPQPLPGAVKEDQSQYERYRVLRENFDALTSKQQETFLRELQDAKQKNEELLIELLDRKKTA